MSGAGWGPSFGIAALPRTGFRSWPLAGRGLLSTLAPWQKALARKNTDPAAALTSARTLLKSTCKHILDDLGGAYAATVDLPDLYSAVAKALNLSPSQHTEQIF